MKKRRDLNKSYTVLKGENGEDIIVKKPLRDRFDAWVADHPAAEKILLGSLIGLGAVGGFALGSASEKKKRVDSMASLIEDNNITVDMNEDGSYKVEVTPNNPTE